jgi:molybdopterin/thiamine biosynthesis adenylyltransferase
MPEIGRVTLIDRDAYARDNLHTQDIHAADIDKPKSVVQARRLRRINPGLRVDSIVDAVEHVPLGRLRCDVILAGLDSRLARQITSERAWQLGTTLVDAGVDGPGLLARVSVYHPGPVSACLMCQWSGEDFDAIEHIYPCTVKDDGTSGVEAPATNAPSAVGGLAGSLLALECRRVLAEPRGNPRPGRELVMEAAHGNLYVTRLQASPDCSFQGHRHGALVVGGTCPGTTTVGRAIDSAAAATDGPGKPSRLRVIGQSFVTQLTCPQCGGYRDVLTLKPSLRRAGQCRCRQCGEQMVATGFGTRDELTVDALPPRTLNRSLNSVGLRHGDLLAIGGSGPADAAHVIEVANGRRRAAPAGRQR